MNAGMTTRFQDVPPEKIFIVKRVALFSTASTFLFPPAQFDLSISAYQRVNIDWRFNQSIFAHKAFRIFHI